MLTKSLLTENRKVIYSLHPLKGYPSLFIFVKVFKTSLNLNGWNIKVDTTGEMYSKDIKWIHSFWSKLGLGIFTSDVFK